MEVATSSTLVLELWGVIRECAPKGEAHKIKRMNNV